MADEIPLVGELGQVGLRRFSGFIREEFLRELQGKQGVETYKEMGDNDDVIGATLFVIQMLIRQVPWNVEAFSTDPVDMYRADFLDSVLHDMDESFDSCLLEILSMLRYGWSYHEQVYKIRVSPSTPDPRFRSKYNDGLVGWRKLAIRAQDSLWRWEYDSQVNDELVGMTQMPPPSYRMITIPKSKALLFRPLAHKNNPEGRSILRNAYVPWYYKKNIARLEAIGVERDLAGLPVIYVPPEMLSSCASAEAKSTLESYKQIITNLKRDEQEGVILPSAYDMNGNQMYKLELLASAGNRQMDTNQIIERYDRRIAMTMMADFLFIGHQATGSYALIDNKTDFFVTAIGSWLDSIADEFNRVAIPRLFQRNGWPLDRLPTLVHGDIESPDLVKLGAYISQLAGAGANLFPNQQLENWLKKQAGMPIDETVSQEAPTEQTPAPTPSNAGRTSADGPQPHTHDYVVDDNGNGLTRSSNGHVHQILDGQIKPAGTIPHTHTLR